LLKVVNGGDAWFDRIRLANTNPKKEPTAVKKPCQIVTRAAKELAAVVEQFCQSNCLILLPIVNLIESSQVMEQVIHEIQIQTLETILMLSAEQLAGGSRALVGGRDRGVYVGISYRVLTTVAKEHSPRKGVIRPGRKWSSSQNGLLITFTTCSSNLPLF
jgi:hypothetical protein